MCVLFPFLHYPFVDWQSALLWRWWGGVGGSGGGSGGRGGAAGGAGVI